MTGGPGDLGTSAPRPRPPESRLSPVVRITGLVLGFALAIAATLAVFLTDNALYLRLAVIAVAWAFVIAAFSAGRRKTDQAVAEGREAQLRQAYALELEREVAARREYELKLENQLRRETQEAMRAEMDKLRADLASLAGLRDQLVGLNELQADMGRLRHELTEQLSGEMLVERIVMRTQSIRMPADRAELGPAGSDVIDGDPGADDLVARVQPPPVPAAPERPAADALSPFAWLAPRERPAEPPSRHASPTQDDRVARPDSAARHGTAEQPAVVQVPASRMPPPASPVEPDQPAPPVQPVQSAPPVEPDRPAPATGPATQLWAAPEPEAAPHRRRAPEEPAPAPAEPEHEPDVYETAGHQRLTEILAESGSTAGGRRRRRYREDDDPGEDDVLARVLSR